MKIKVDIVLGFLGSGKTTLINLFLKSGEIENELVVIVLFEKGKKYIEEKSKNIIVIYIDNNIYDKKIFDLILTKYMPDRVVFEFNGKDDVDKFIKILNEKSLKKIFKLHKVINVIDSRRAVLYFKNVKKRSSSYIKYSNIVILNNLLYIDKPIVRYIKKYIKMINGSIRIVEFVDENKEKEMVDDRKFCLNTENEKISGKELILVICAIIFFVIIIVYIPLIEKVGNY